MGTELRYAGYVKRQLADLAEPSSQLSLALQHDLSLKSGTATPVSGEGSQNLEGTQTAETSAQASPKEVIVIDDGDEVPLGRGKRVKRVHVSDDLEILHFSPPPAESKKRKDKKGKGKAHEAVAIADGPGWFFSSTKDQFEARMDNFMYVVTLSLSLDDGADSRAAASPTRTSSSRCCPRRRTTMLPRSSPPPRRSPSRRIALSLSRPPSPTDSRSSRTTSSPASASSPTSPRTA